MAVYQYTSSVDCYSATAPDFDVFVVVDAAATEPYCSVTNWVDDEQLAPDPNHHLENERIGWPSPWAPNEQPRYAPDTPPPRVEIAGPVAGRPCPRNRRVRGCAMSD